MLDFLKNLFDRHLFLKDEVSKTDLLKLSQRDVLTNFLPYLSFSEKMKSDENNEEVVSNAFLNFDNTIGWIWELVPPPFVGPDKLDMLHGIVRTPLPKGTVMQWILYPDDNIDNTIQEYKSLRNSDDPINCMNMEQMEEYLRSGTKGVKKMANIPIRNFRLFLTIKNESRISEDILVSIEQGLAMSGMAPHRWHANNLLAWLAKFFNNEVSYPEYDPNKYLRSQFRSNNPAVNEHDTDVTPNRPLDDFGTYPARVGNRYVTCLYPNAVPQKKNNPIRTNQLFGGFMGMQDDMNQIKHPFMYTLTIVYDDLKAEINNKATQTMFQKVGGGLVHALNERIVEFTSMQSTMAKDGVFSYMIPQVMVFGDTPGQVRAAAAQAIKLWDNLGFKMMKETKMASTMFIHGLPFGLYHIDQNMINMDRYYYLDQENITRFLPVQGDFRGGGRPVQLYQGRKGQIITLDMFDPRANAHNFYVVAETGGGKSFTLNDLLDSYYSTGAKVRVADLGASYKKLTLMRKGRYIDFSIDNPLCMNPLDFVSLDTEDFQKNISAAQIVFSACAYSNTGKAVNEIEANLLSQACLEAHKRGDHQRGTDFLIDYFSNRKNYETSGKIDFKEVHDSAERLAYLLKNFGSNGPFGKFMVGHTQFSIKDDDFVCVDIEKLASIRQLFFPMVMQVMNSITQDLYLSDRSRPSLILFEEIASMAKKKGDISMDGFADMVEEGYRRARKYRGAFGIVLQSALDLKLLKGLGDVAKANAQWRFYLESKMYSEAAKTDALPGIDDGFPLKLLNSVKNARPNYGEIFIDSPLGMGVARLCVDPWRYWVNTSDGKDVAAFEALLKRGVEPVDALSQLSGVAIPNHIRQQIMAAGGELHAFPAA